MDGFTCDCLNVSIDISTQALPTQPRDKEDSLGHIFDDAISAEVENQNIHIKCPLLVQKKLSTCGDWETVTCSNCSVSVYAQHTKKPGACALNKSLQRECASLEAVRQREDFSKLFNMIVKTNAELDQDEIIKVLDSSERHQCIQQQLQGKLQSFLAHERQAMLERIRNYKAQQERMFSALKEKSTLERDCVYRLICSRTCPSDVTQPMSLSCISGSGLSQTKPEIDDSVHLEEFQSPGQSDQCSARKKSGKRKRGCDEESPETPSSSTVRRSRRHTRVRFGYGDDVNKADDLSTTDGGEFSGEIKAKPLIKQEVVPDVYANADEADVPNEDDIEQYQYASDFDMEGSYSDADWQPMEAEHENKSENHVLKQENVTQVLRDHADTANDVNNAASVNKRKRGRPRKIASNSTAAAAGTKVTAPKVKVTSSKVKKGNVNKGGRNGSFPCIDCGNVYTRKHYLKTHVELICPERRVNATCKVCGQVYTTPKALRQHECAGSKFATAVTCQFCAKPYPSAHLLRKHVARMHKPKQCACQFCGKQFYYERDLETHVKLHTDKQNITCQKCNMQFLRSHDYFHHTCRAKESGNGSFDDDVNIKQEAMETMENDTNAGAIEPAAGAIEQSAGAIEPPTDFYSTESVVDATSTENPENTNSAEANDCDAESGEWPESVDTTADLGDVTDAGVSAAGNENGAESNCSQSDSSDAQQQKPLTMEELQQEIADVRAKSGRGLIEIMDITSLDVTMQQMLRHMKHPSYGVEPYDGRYHCVACNKSFGDVYQFKKHVVLKHGNFRCQQCSQKFFDLARFPTHICDSYCDICDIDFRFKNNYKLHMRTEHNLAYDFYCPVCSAGFTTQYRMTRHALKHDTAQTLECAICQTKFKHKASLKLHARFCNQQGRIQCNTCPQTFATRDEYNEHYRAQHHANLPCDYCDEIFSTRSNLKRHLNRFHPQHTTYNCPRCAASFKTQAELITHKEQECRGADLDCSNCKQHFTQKSHHERHEAMCLPFTFTDGRYACHQCDMTFTSLSYIRSHNKRVHLKQFTFLCNLCGKGFMAKDKLHDHSIRHTKKKPFGCTICQRRFYLEAELNRHAPKCQGPGLPCPHCDRVFYSADYHAKHIKYQHENPTAFQCTICGSSLTGARNLVNHKRDVHGIMAGDPRPKRLPPDAFKCTRCDRRLTSRRNLRHHLERVHNVREETSRDVPANDGGQALNVAQPPPPPPAQQLQQAMMANPAAPAATAADVMFS